LPPPTPTRSSAAVTVTAPRPQAPGTPQPTAKAKAKAKITSLGTPEPSSTPCSPRGGTATAAAKSKSKPKPNPATPRRGPSFTKKCAKLVPLTNIFSRLSSSSLRPPLSPSSPRGGYGSPSAARRWKFASGLTSDNDDGVRSALARFPAPPVADPPPPYQLRVANPAPERESTAVEGGGGTANRASPWTTPVSSSRFTAASVEAIRAPDSPVPTFPSPKPSSTESVFGSTESLASSFQSSGSATISALRCPRRNSTAAAAGPTLPVLRRRDTIRSPLRITLSSGYLDVRPMFRSS